MHLVCKFKKAEILNKATIEIKYVEWSVSHVHHDSNLQYLASVVGILHDIDYPPSWDVLLPENKRECTYNSIDISTYASGCPLAASPLSLSGGFPLYILLHASYFRSPGQIYSHWCRGGLRSPVVACWTSDHWVASSIQLRGKFRH